MFASIRKIIDQHIHVHVFDGDNEAKVGLVPIEILDNWGFNNRELSQIIQLIEQHLELLLTEWDKYHPSR